MRIMGLDVGDKNIGVAVSDKVSAVVILQSYLDSIN